MRLNPNIQIPNPKQIPMTKCPITKNTFYTAILNFGHCDLGHYLVIGSWNLVIPCHPAEDFGSMGFRTTSCWILSKMPLIKLPESSDPYLFPRSIASLIVTLGGISSQKRSSKIAIRRIFLSIRLIRSRRQFSEYRSMSRSNSEQCSKTPRTRRF